MVVKLITDPGSANIPLLPTSGRSSLQTLKRMNFLRWSAAEFLSAVANNRGFQRPSLGFGDDDFFRGMAQALIGEFKAISYSFESILEVVLGPYEDMYFELDGSHSDGAEYLQYAPYGDYIAYDPLSLVGSYTVGERIEAIHPSTRKRTIALVKEHDATLHRIYFTDEAREEDALPFDNGVQIVGKSSGAKANAIGPVVRRDHYAFPLYGKATIDPGGANEEEVTFVAPDPYVGRVRLVTNLSSSHADATQIRITGGCWELIDTQARRAVIRINCLRDDEYALPGNSYLHPSSMIDAKLRAVAVGGGTVLLLDNLVLEAIAAGAFPMKVVLNPDNEHQHANSLPVVVTASSYDPVTQQMTLSAPLASGSNYVPGTKARWYQSRKGEIINPVSAGDTLIAARCRWENPYGIWRINPGGPGEEEVFVKKTTYQKRRLMSQIEPTTTVVYSDHPFINPNTLSGEILAVSDPVLGSLGFAAIDTVQGNEITLQSAALFSTDIYNSLKPTTLEIVKDTNYTVDLELASGVSNSHSAGTPISEMLGTNALDPSYSDHLVQGNWPQAEPSTDPWRWPGPHVYAPSQRSPINTQASGLASCEIDRSSLNDYRIFMANEAVVVDYNPAFAPSAIGPQYVPSLGRSINTTKLVVSNGEKFPTQASINYWRFSDPTNTIGDPPEIVIGAEGGFNRSKVFLFGRGTAGTADENVLYVGGITRSHLAGTRVRTYVDKMPVSGALNIFGGDPGFDIGGGTFLLDHTTITEEEVDYSSIQTRTPTQAFFVFDRGFSPEYSHDPIKTSNVDPTIVVGVQIMRADKLSVPRRDGFSFPLYLGGSLTLRRLKVALNLARAVGVKLHFVNDKDRPIPL